MFDGGAVDENNQFPELVMGYLHRREHCQGVTHIALDCNASASLRLEIIRYSPGRLRIDINACHGAASVRKGTRGRLAQAAACSGNQDGLSLQTCNIHMYPPYLRLQHER